MPSWRRRELHLDVAQVVPVDADRAGGGVVEARKQLDQRRLAGTRVPDERYGLPGSDREIDAVQHLGALAVVEVHAGELDRTLDRRQRLRVVGVPQLGTRVHDVEDLVERSARGEERVEELRERLDRVEEVRQEEHEGEQRADRDRIVEIEDAAVGQHDRRRGGAEQADEREVPGVELNGAVVGAAVVVADLAEGLRVAALAPECLHDARPGEILGQRRGHIREPLAHAPVGACRVDPEERRRERHQREDRERREREPPVEEEQDARRARTGAGCSGRSSRGRRSRVPRARRRRSSGARSASRRDCARNTRARASGCARTGRGAGRRGRAVRPRRRGRSGRPRRPIRAALRPRTGPSTGSARGGRRARCRGRSRTWRRTATRARSPCRR